MSEFREITPECRANRGDYPAFDQACHDLWHVYGVMLHRHPDATFVLTLGRKQPATPASSAGRAPAADRAALRERIAEAFARYDWNVAPVFRSVTPNADHYALADAVLAVLPAPTDQTAVLLAAADELDRYVGKQSSDAAPEVEGARLVIRELRRIAGQPTPVEEGKCGCFSPSGAYRCTQPAGHLGYHRHTRPDTDEWSSWVTGTTEAELRRLAGEAQQNPTQDGRPVCSTAGCGHDETAHGVAGCRDCPRGWRAFHLFSLAAVARPGQPETDAETPHAGESS